MAKDEDINKTPANTPPEAPEGTSAPEVPTDGPIEGELVQDGIERRDVENTMEEYFLKYSMSVIIDRALPDVRDGLKPVNRRILYTMNKNGWKAPHATVKSARIVGDVMGKYHPHGDSSIYMAMVNLAQPWKMRYTLIEGQGNFGSMDGDEPAAYRYTEARMDKVGTELLADIEKDTVDFRDNFDGTEQEPVVLPAALPNILLNGQMGIAVGMATNIPPHNLGELIDATVQRARFSYGGRGIWWCTYAPSLRYWQRLRSDSRCYQYRRTQKRPVQYSSHRSPVRYEQRRLYREGSRTSIE